jgi:outer membrane murein-binding lipoprotein Lpp
MVVNLLIDGDREHLFDRLDRLFHLCHLEFSDFYWAKLNQMNSEIIIALSAFITAILAAAGTFYANKKAARKDDVAMLRDQVSSLYAQIETLEQDRVQSRKEFEALLDENYALRSEVSQLSIQIQKLQSELQDGIALRLEIAELKIEVNMLRSENKSLRENSKQVAVSYDSEKSREKSSG